MYYTVSEWLWYRVATPWHTSFKGHTILRKKLYKILIIISDKLSVIILSVQTSNKTNRPTNPRTHHLYSEKRCRTCTANLYRSYLCIEIHLVHIHSSPHRLHPQCSRLCHRIAGLYSHICSPVYTGLRTLDYRLELFKEMISCHFFCCCLIDVE